MTKRGSGVSFDLKGRSILGDLISGASADSVPDAAAEWILIDRIRPSKQPRRYFSPEGLERLAQSFRERGFQGTINVRPGHDGFYDLVAGERRWRAAQQAGLEKVRCIVEAYSDQEALEFALVENLLREDLSKIEETEGILDLIEQKQGIQRSLAISIIRTAGHPDKRNRSDVAPNKDLQAIESILTYFGIELQTFRTKNLRTLELPEELRTAHLEKNLPYSSALEISKVKDDAQRQALLDEALQAGLSFREIKERVRQHNDRPLSTDSKSSVLISRLEQLAKRSKSVESHLTQKKHRDKLNALLNDLEAFLEQLDS